MRTLRATLAGACLVVSAGVVSAQVEVLTTGLVAQLDPAKEKRLTLAPNGDLARFLAGDGEWQEAAPPWILDLDRDGIRDFVVLMMLDVRTTRRALIIHDWGDAPDTLGNAVFYVILDAEDHVVEWAGTHQLTPRPAPDTREPPRR